MSRADHTPGPWQLAGETTEDLSGGPTDVPFIHVEAEGFNAGGGICMVHDKRNRVGRANAILIAAAPDLLAACIAAQEGTGDWRAMLDLAITKATK